MAQISVPHPGLPMNSEEDERAVDSRRLAVLIEEHLDFVWRSLRRLGVPASGTDDATQQVWLVLARRLSEISSGQERAFLFGTAMRVASDARRRAAKRREVSGLEHVDFVDPSPTPLDLLARRQARRLLDQVLDGLADDLRAVFVLYELEEQTAAQIADLLHIPAGTVASRLRRARAEFEQIAKRLKARQGRLPMTDLPERLLSGVASDWERSLLESAAELDAPTPEFKRAFAGRLSTALSAAGVLTVSSAGHAAAGLSWLKWLAVGFVVGTAGAGAGSQLVDWTKHDAPTALRSAAPPSHDGPAVAHKVATPSALLTSTASPALARRAPSTPTSSVNAESQPAFSGLAPTVAVQISHSGPGTQKAPALSVEMAELEFVREALARGDAARALSGLDAYDARHLNGSLFIEAHVLRIEALAAAGQVAAARSLARRFLSEQPGSPYTKHVTSIALSASEK